MAASEHAAQLGSLVGNPDLDRWIAFSGDDVVVRTGKAELGQGIRTALVAIAADELGVDPGRIRVEGPATGSSPNEFLTAGSVSIQTSGAAVRQACAHARRILVARAADDLGVPAPDLIVDDGRVVAPDGRSVGFGDLAARPFDYRVEEPAETVVAGDRRWVGHGLPRQDLNAKMRGEPVFVHDLRLAGMRHARVVRPPRPGATVSGPVPERIGAAAVVRRGSFLAVVADRERDAVAASQALRDQVSWEGGGQLAVDGDQPGYLAAHVESSSRIVDGADSDAPVGEPMQFGEGARVVRAAYSKPFIMHASIGPSAAVAAFQDGHLTVWSHSQGVEPLRMAVADLVGLPADDVTVIHRDGAGCYGHNGADDAAADAALVAVAVPGTPISLPWSRADEHRWEPLGPAMAVHLAAEVSEEGRIASWDQEIFTYSHVARPLASRPGLSALLASWYLEEPRRPFVFPGRGYHMAGHRNGDPFYDVGVRRVVRHDVGASPLRTSAARSLGAFANVFAIESFMDEVALAAGVDPVELRIAHLRDQRAVDVIRAAVDLAGGLVAPGGVDAPGRGLGFACYENNQAYAAIVAEVQVDPGSGLVRLRHAWIAADVGAVVDPDGVVNQIEGGFVQAASWALKERVPFDADGVTATDWEAYPILRFSEVPDLTTRILDRPDEPSVGAGEVTAGPTAAAIGNAFAQATGMRLRDLPLTPQRVQALLDSAL